LHEAAIEEPVDVADVGTIFERGPDIGLRTCGNRGTRSQNLHPFFSRDKRSLSELFGFDLTD